MPARARPFPRLSAHDVPQRRTDPADGQLADAPERITAPRRKYSGDRFLQGEPVFHPHCHSLCTIDHPSREDHGIERTTTGREVPFTAERTPCRCVERFAAEWPNRPKMFRRAVGEELK
ncbi:hypothetical protein D5S19_00965 [Amycolatopsis panacis]|uniref:Uncharacterized protein n=1 Tax=Amycolatopsis panacis TaxID=2340917 RepID=A0A419IBR0_9PSEU|nr:hypothetical protein D5S19_00965 [Amycolatopsis panacis]